jgi:thioredoxin-related protein
VNLTDFDGNTLQEKIFAQRHNLVGATPVLAFFDLNGKRVVRHTGFANKKDFSLLANYFVDKSYKGIAVKICQIHTRFYINFKI